ncbi:MAG: hypothetical protein U9Q37_04610 [Euryarchaeota archaeon]|nr:hypothetical protein [Euryarchaeota archaeon]
MIVDAFLNLLRDAIYGDSVTYPSYIAIGTGTTAATASDTAIETEVFPDGANRSAISSRTKPAAKQVRLQMLVGAGEANGNDLTEVGALNAASSGTLTNRVVHTAISKDASFELKYQIQITLSDV